jgi:hypothetical protein
MQRSATAIEHTVDELAPAGPSEVHECAAAEPAEAAVSAEDLALAMERYANQLSEMIRSQPPRALIGYIWAHWTLGAPDSIPGPDETVRTFLLHYVHAIFAAHAPHPKAQLDEAVCADIIACADTLHTLARRYCDALRPSQPAEAVAKSSWVWPPARPAALDAEFLAFVLDPHNEALRQKHGIGAADIIKRLLAIPGTMQSVREGAAQAIEAQIAGVAALSQERGVDSGEAALLWCNETPEQARKATRAYVDLLEGGLCNLSAYTDLPITLLRDLAFEPGSEQDFCAPGPLVATPLRTLPARCKPLIKLQGDFFALDPAVLREAYRPLLLGLGADFEAQQRAASESAFARALSEQLRGARVDSAVCYRDVQSHEWAQHDLVIRHDDVLIVVDAQAAIAPPAHDFGRHVQGVLKVVAAAYQRSLRLLDYLNSAAEVPIFRRNGGRTVEFGRIRLSDYRMVLPIGLTVEPLAPFSTLCTALPSMQPILGRHAFMAMSVDDLLLLRHVLATPEELLDYMGYRQQAAGEKSAPRYFEADHLADYAAMVASEIATEPAVEPPDESEGETGSEIGAQAAEDTSTQAEAAVEADTPPEPARPREVANLLVALEAAHEAGWQRARDALRSRDADACDVLATALRAAAETLTTQECRWLHDHGEPPLFIWLQRFGTRADLAALKLKAKKVAIGAGERSITAILAHTRAPGDYSRAVSVGIVIPPQDSTEYRRYRAEAAEAKAREDRAQVRPAPQSGSAAPARKIGRNEPCWCGSGKKFKRCHGGQ